MSSWVNKLPTKLLFMATVFAMVSFYQNNCLASSWIRTFGGSAHEAGSDVQPHRDGGYVAIGNGYNSGAIILKVDSEGNKKWQRTILDDADHDISFYSIAPASDGGFIIGGSIAEQSGVDPGSECYLLKVDNNGVQKWHKTFSWAGYDSIVDAKVAHGGGYICAGLAAIPPGGEAWPIVIRTDNKGNKKWMKTYELPNAYESGAFSLQLTPDGGYIIAGWAYIENGDGPMTLKTYIFKIKDNGTLQWKKVYDGEDAYSSIQIQCTASDNGYIVVAGKDLMKIDSHGNLKWRKTRGHLFARSLQVTSDGGFIITGSADSAAHPNESEIYLLKTDKSGNQKWRRQFSKTTNTAKSIKKTRDGGFILVGSDSNNGGNICLIKTDKSGKVAR
jgi:hypothetical protein